MGGNEAKSIDFYHVLGVKKECTEAELKHAYKKLALKWHPDRCSASGNSKYVEESKKKFQAIQEAYSVLSDVDKRFLYDVGVYDSDDDENGMADFMSEMAEMGNGESFEELQDLFEELFESDIESYGSTSQTSYSSSSFSSFGESSSSNSSNKRGSSAMSNAKTEDPSYFDPHFEGFSLGTGGRYEDRSGGRRKGRHV